MTEPRDQDAILTAQEAADELRINVSLIWAHCRDGEQPFLKHWRVGNEIRILRRELYVWLDAYTDKFRRTRDLRRISREEESDTQNRDTEPPSW